MNLRRLIPTAWGGCLLACQAVQQPVPSPPSPAAARFFSIAEPKVEPEPTSATRLSKASHAPRARKREAENSNRAAKPTPQRRLEQADGEAEPRKIALGGNSGDRGDRSSRGPIQGAGAIMMSLLTRTFTVNPGRTLMVGWI